MVYTELVKPTIDTEFLKLKARNPKYTGYRMRTIEETYRHNGVTDSVIVLNKISDAIVILFYGEGFDFQNDFDSFTFKSETNATTIIPTIDEQVLIPPVGVGVVLAIDFEQQGFTEKINSPNSIHVHSGKTLLICHAENLTNPRTVKIAYVIATPY